MRQAKRPKAEGPTLRGEQVSELWVWIYFAVEERKRTPVPTDAQGWELNEARRLLIAFDRAIGRFRDRHDYKPERYVRDQDARDTARLSQYLAARIAQWSARLGTATEAESVARLRIVRGASSLLHSLLRVSAEQMAAVCERLEVGENWPHSIVFYVRSTGDVVIESVEEGPVLPEDEERRHEFCRAADRIKWDRPKKRRAVAGDNP